MNNKSVGFLLILLLFAGSVTANLPSASLQRETSLNLKDSLLVNPAGTGQSPKCSSFASVLSVLAIPCNGVSVTSVVFDATTRTVVSGTNNTVGVVYRYPNVGTTPDGTLLDALVTVVSYANNQDANQTNFSSSDVPGATAGYDNNLQPNINEESTTFLANTNWQGSIKYNIQFVAAGTLTPRRITVAATSIDNDGASTCGLLRESVSYSAGLNQVLIAAATTQTIAGSTVTGPTTNQANIGIGSDFANSALFVNISQFDWTYSFTTSGNCTAGSASPARYGSLNLSCQIDFGRTFASAALSGNIFNDANGLTDSTVNGVGTGTPGGTQVYANLIDTNGFVVASVAVAGGGAYSFPTVVAGTYDVQISTVQGVVSNAAPATTLPSGWVNTGENLGAAAGNDGSANGSLAVTVAAAAVTNANFGIEQTPVPNNNTAATQVNPGGTTNLSVPAGTFTAADAAPGTVSSIRITAFPTSVLSITINGTQYTAGTFPVAGVVIPANVSGNPTQAILVDPFDGPRNIDIPYAAIDNAGVQSSTTAIARLPVSAGTTAANAAISGRVLDDQGRGSAHVLVMITDQNGSVGSALTNPFGYYRIVDIRAGELYLVFIKSKRFSYQSRTVTLDDDLADLDFVPQP